MEVQIKDRQAVEASVEVTLTTAEVQGAYDTVMQQLVNQVNIPGFRPGKVPPAVLLKRVGEEAINAEVREALLDDNYVAALEEAELTPLNVHFHADQPVRGEPFTFTIHAELAPEVVLPDLDEIIIDTTATPVSDADIAAAVERMQRQNSTLVPVDRPSQPTDVVLIETLTEGEEDGEGDPAEPGSTMPIELDNVSEDLAAQLLGRQLGDVVELVFGATEEADEADEVEESEEDEVDDAETGEDEAATETVAEAAGQSKMRVRIADVQERDLPAADDELAKTLGFDEWSEVLELIRSTLQEQQDTETFEAQQDELVGKLLAGNEFEVPRSMLNRRQEFLLGNLEDDLKQQNITVGEYVSQLEEEGTREKFEQELLASATAAVRRDLVLEQLMIARQVELTDDEFREALEQAAQQENVSVRELRRERGEEWLENYRFLLSRNKALDDAVRERVAAAAVAAIE